MSNDSVVMISLQQNNNYDGIVLKCVSHVFVSRLFWCFLVCANPSNKTFSCYLVTIGLVDIIGSSLE